MSLSELGGQGGGLRPGTVKLSRDGRSAWFAVT